MKISIKAIDNPIIVTLFTVSVLVIGLISLSFLPLELFPEVETPYVFVTVQYPGASPSEIEYQINKKIEDELKTLSDFKQITSIAAQGVGTVVIQFRSKSNVDVKRSEVKEAMDNVLPDLPKGIETPIIRKLDFAKVPVMSVLIYGKGKNYVELKDIAEDIKEIFEEIPQVSNVQIFGGEDREITIAVNPLQIWGNKISLTQVVQFFAGANLDSPGGKISIGKRDYPIRTLAKFKDVTDVKNTVFTYRDGKPIYLKDLGEIYDGKAEVTSFARLNGDPAIALAIIKESKTNLIKLSDGISKRIEMIKSSGLLPKGLDIKIVGDQTSEVKIRVNELTSNVIQGIIAVFIILFIGLGAKNALIASLSIPFCMIFTMIGLLIFNETINNIMQFGLIIIVGMVVDGAIVVMENIYRHREMGKSLINSSKDGTEEVGASVISSVLTTMAAFAPMLFMTGIIGDFMSAIPKTVILALSGSLLFDHIVIPVLCSKFLDVRAHDEVSPIVILFKKIVKVKSITKIHPFEWIFEKYKKLIRWSITHRKSVVLTTIAVFILGFGLLLSLSRESFPELDLGKLWVDIELPKNTKIEATNEVTEDIEKIIEKYRKTESNPKGIVKHYSVNVGSSGVQVFITGNIGQEQGPHIARIDIDLIDQEERDIGIDDFISKLRKEILEQCVGAKIKVNKPKGGPPTGATINIVISGDKLIELKRLANKA
ncbi:MAG: efflux RND transporter permease subunit, partial [Spirochaetota bacterium]|nr:efflux RND transporter permease subunit [Spirochaetota bacterium]